MKYLLTLLLFWITAQASVACSCGACKLERSCKQDRAIFVARVIALHSFYDYEYIDFIGLKGILPMTRYVIVISEILKGKELICDSITYIDTQKETGASCSYPFELNKEYIIFASDRLPWYATSLCSCTSAYKTERVVQIKRILQEQEQKK